MKITVWQLVTVDDGMIDASLHPNLDAAWGAVLENHWRAVKREYRDNLPDKGDAPVVIEHLAEIGIDVHIEEHVIDTDQFPRAQEGGVETHKWARCKECGGEVVFDSWADYSGETVNVFDQAFCGGCDGEIGRFGFTVETGYPDSNEEGN